jgi:hypothetical protein
MLSLLTPDAELGTGTTKNVFHAQADGSSMLKVFASLSQTNAKLTLKMVTALPASKAMMLKTANAFSPTPTTPSQVTQVAEPGTGTTKNACLALSDGSSMLRAFAFLFLTNAKPMLIMETALPASKAMMLKKVNASSLSLTTPSLQTPDAEPGTGTTKNVFPAQADGSSTLKVPACLFLTTAELTLKMVTALPATKDTT